MKNYLLGQKNRFVPAVCPPQCKQKSIAIHFPSSSIASNLALGKDSQNLLSSL
jgi:hypothetical protein